MGSRSRSVGRCVATIVAMRAIWVFTLLVACHSTATAPDAHISGTPLSGTTSCEGVTCGSGQICRDDMALPDDGSIPTACVDVPTTCVVFDCGLQGQAACPQCVDQLCAQCSAGGNCGELMGRELRCY